MRKTKRREAGGLCGGEEEEERPVPLFTVNVPHWWHMGNMWRPLLAAEHHGARSAGSHRHRAFPELTAGSGQGA